MTGFDSLDTPKQVNASCLEFLLMEMVSNSVKMTQLKEDDSPPVTITKDASLQVNPTELPGSIAHVEHSLLNKDDVTLRNENHGFQVGIRLCELLMYKSSSNPKITSILEIMKFVCRDVWRCLYGKQMDNLRTNHRGIFVLVDNNCKLISQMNSSKGVPDSIARSRTFLWFPCGVIRGILASFGIESLVSADITQFPAVTFSIQTGINN